MTVAELIEKLKLLDPELRVLLEVGCDGELLGAPNDPEVVTAHGWAGDSVWAGPFSGFLAEDVVRPDDFSVVLLR